MAHTRESIIHAAYQAAQAKHVSELTLNDVAESAGCSLSVPTKKGLTIAVIRDEVERMARKRGEWRVMNGAARSRKPLDKSSILAAAITVARRKGDTWHRMGMKEVADEAGCSKPTVYKHFGSMAVLCRAVAKGMSA